MNNSEQGNNLFPIFLKMEKLPTLVVGGGKVGLEKLHAILKNSPQAPIALVAITVDPEIRALGESYTNLTIKERAFRPEDLSGIRIALLATEDRNTHRRIGLMAKSRNIPVNVADTPDLCDF